MEEIWRDIAGYEGIYQVSNLGSVRNSDKLILKQQIFNGYMNIGLSKNCYKKRFFTHRLVASAFVAKIKGKNIVNHKDFNKTNNNHENLEFCTQKENINHAISAGRFYFNHKDKIIDIPDEIINRLGSCCDRELAEIAGVDRKTIGNRRAALGIKSYAEKRKERKQL